MPCKAATHQQLGACVCRHADFRAMKADVDEQEDIVHELMEKDVRGADWPKEASVSQVAVRHVENMVVPQGGVYTGQARDDGQPHGIGTQRWPDGTVYCGAWVAGAAHGRGKLSKSDGSSYEGAWLEGRKHGEGCEWLADKSQYKGEFADGQKHGPGLFQWDGGASYLGQFCEDALQGEGTFHWGDGRTYRGQWVQSRMHGQGRFEWPDGKFFEGKYESDKKHGPGVFAWPDGSKCVGIWLSGKQHGIGTHVSSRGKARKGRWKNGVLEQWTEPLLEGEDGGLASTGILDSAPAGGCGNAAGASLTPRTVEGAKDLAGPTVGSAVGPIDVATSSPRGEDDQAR